MSRAVVSLAVLSAATLSLAQYTPLVDKHYSYPSQIPYQVDTDPTGRGPQFGYNICNSTTQNQNSDCQTAILNNAGDFCLWAPPDPDSTIGVEEARTVAWCTASGHGTRVMPANTITGLQVLKAPSYILFAGTINQQNVNIDPTDGGGEMDPHGDDARGNPLGGLVYSNAFPSNNGNNNSYQQVIEWHNFMGSQMFCFKICDPSVSDSTQYCNNVFDRTGCQFVAPASYAAGTFETCDSEDQDPVGVYTSNGQRLTYSQPPEGVDITSLPSVKTPASSNCQTYTSAALFAGESGASSSASASSSSASASSTSAAASRSSSKASGSSSSSSLSTSTVTRNVAGTSSSSAASSSGTSGAAFRAAQNPVGAVVGYGPFFAVAGTVVLGALGVLAGGAF